MLRSTHRTNRGNAKGYFEKTLSIDYYGNESPGVWHKGADDIGIQPGDTITREQFHALCDNVNPTTGDRLNARTPKRVYYDFTFSVPKSVSVAYFYHQDDRIRDVFMQAVKQTIDVMEQTDMQVRVRKAGEDYDRQNSNMLVGLFDEYTTRPVDGVPDPHMHCHAVCFNSSYDEVEGIRKAGQFGQIKQHMPYHQAAFEAIAAKGLAEIGYGVRRSAKGWELAHVPNSVVEKFSRRTAQIEDLANQLGITDPDIKATLGATSRDHKSQVPEHQLEATWHSWLTEEEKAVLNSGLLQGQPNAPGAAEALDYALDYALEHVFERNSTTTERQLMTEALRYGVGAVTLEDLQAEFARRDDILTKERAGQTYLTTQAALDEEREMIALVIQGRGTKPALNLAVQGFDPIVTGDGRSFELNPQQQAAGLDILHSNDPYIALRGGAGVGKTTVAQEVVKAINAAGHEVFTFAPTSDAVKVLQNEGFHNAATVQRLLTDTKLRDSLRSQVMWIDEAGLMGSRQMNQIFKLARELDARVILSGDSRQHRAVERGDALRILENAAGLSSAEVNEITRQRGAYKKAVEAIAKGDIKDGFKKLDRMKAIREISDDTRHQQLAQDYLKATRRNVFGKRYSALVVAPTHAEGDAVTGLIRDQLKNLKEHDGRKLGEDERTFTQLRNLSWTQAQRKDAYNYTPGQVVQFIQRSEGIKPGERFTIVGWNNQGDVVVRNQDGLTHHLNLDNAPNFQVYDQRTLDLAPSDKIRITQNGWSEDGQRLTNGAIYDVAGFTKDREGEITGIRLGNGWAVGKDYGNLAHGYVVTSYASQGKTVDHVLVAEGAQSLPAASLEQFYVSVSRGKRTVTIYTDDKEALQQAALESSKRLSATELMEEQQKQRALERTTKVEQWMTLAHTYAHWFKEAWPAVQEMFASVTPTVPMPERGPELDR